MATPKAPGAIEKLPGIPENQKAIERLDRIVKAISWMEELAGDDHGLNEPQLREHQRLAQTMYDSSVFPLGMTSELAERQARRFIPRRLPDGLIELEEI